MKKFFIIFLFLGTHITKPAASDQSSLNLPNEQQTSACSRNLIMLLDIDKEPHEGFLTHYLALGLNAKVSSLIVSDTVLYNYLQAYKDLVQKGNLASWLIYKHNGAGIFLFIQSWGDESMMFQAAEEQNKDYTAGELESGFVINHASIMQPIGSSYDELAAAVTLSTDNKIGLKSVYNKQSDFPLAALKSLFVKDKNSLPWHIFLSGHGFYEPTVVEYYDYMNSIAAQLAAFSQKIASLPSEEISQEAVDLALSALNNRFIVEQKAKMKNIFDPSAADIAEFFQRTIEQAASEGNLPVVKAAFEYILSKAMPAYTQAANEPAVAFIAGIPKGQFIELFSFLKNTLYTEFFYYTTCFGGGVNLATVEKYLSNEEKDVAKSVHPNFTVVVGAVADSMVYSLFDEQDYIKMHAGEILEDKYNFKHFFEILCEGLADSVGYREDTLKKAFRALRRPQPETDSNMIYFTNTPSVYFPETSVFRAIEPDQDIKIITHTLLSENEAANSMLDARNKHAILFYAEDIRVPLIVGATNNKKLVWPAFVSMIPGSATHHLKEVIAPDIDYQDFIASAFTQIDYAYYKTWMIDRLELGRFSDYADDLLQGASNFFKYTGAEGSELPNPPDATAPIIVQDFIIKQSSIKRELGGLGTITSRWNIFFKDANQGLYYILENYDPAVVPRFEKHQLTEDEVAALKNRLFDI